MARYQTMTVGGLMGNAFEADTLTDAIEAAEAQGYDVLEAIDHGGLDVLVVSD